MPVTDRFEDLIVWQEAMHLAKDIFTLFENCKNFSIQNQIERAVVSISANIAEGYELDTDKQFIKHLFISKPSCGEIRSLLILSRELGLFSSAFLDPLIAASARLSVMIYNLIKVSAQRPYLTFRRTRSYQTDLADFPNFTVFTLLQVLPYHILRHDLSIQHPNNSITKLCTIL